ncbi:unnamed protein product [Ambrosiozyma monospora]|uniref:Unnamed protein product n=1 Tax=Ambrosiozyma monospora TaxID=43982 RepID=A0ACB5TAF1_AMBMO|nr:unnamed protein product [Ambrosiozyma monospora]
MFLEVVIDFDYMSHTVCFFQEQPYNDYHLIRFKEYLKAHPPKYFKLIISLYDIPDRNGKSKQMELFTDCGKLANEIKCHSSGSVISFLISEGVSHKVTEILLDYSYGTPFSLENFTNVKSLTSDTGR